jgi:hypothetical protein
MDFIVSKTTFWNLHAAKLNERQTKVITAMLKTGKDGFNSGMSAHKYMSITGCSKSDRYT